MKLKVLAAGTVLALTALTTAHAQTLTGCYVPQSGFANSQSIPVVPSNPELGSLEQIGSCRIVLVKKTGLLRDRLVLSGPFKGMIVGTGQSGGPLLDHVLGDLNLEGLILTEDDVGTFPKGFTPPTVEVEEVLNPVAGTGKFKGLDTGEDNSITVTGTLDLDTGTNMFDVKPGVGKLCFKVIQ